MLRHLAAVCSALALAACAEPLPDTPAALLAFAETRPAQASVLVLELASGRVLRAAAPDSARAAAGLPALWLALAVADTSALPGLIPASAVRTHRVPGVGAEAAGREALTAPALARAALAGDVAAADALLHRLGRARVEVLPGDTSHDGLDAPVPTGGLHLAWAPLGRSGTPADRAAAFRRLPPAARADSAYDRARTFATSPSVRAEESARWARGCVGLAEADLVETARATYPRATAAGVGAWLRRAARGGFGVPGQRVRENLPAADEAGVRVAWGSGPGLASAAAIGPHRVAVVLVEGLPAAESGRLADLARALVVHLVANPTPGDV